MSCCPHCFQDVTHLIYLKNTCKLYDGDGQRQKKISRNQYQNNVKTMGTKVDFVIVFFVKIISQLQANS